MLVSQHSSTHAAGPAGVHSLSALGLHPTNKRQALGLVESLETRRFENGAHGNGNYGPPTAPGRSSIASSSDAASDSRAAADETRLSEPETADAAAGARAVAATAAEAPPQSERIAWVMQLHASAPVVAAVGSHQAELSWATPEAHLQQLSNSCPTDRSHPASTGPPCSLTHVVELAQGMPAQVSSSKPLANGKTVTPQVSEPAWFEVYRGTALACQVPDLKPGTAYLVRVRVKDDSAAQQFATAAAKAAQPVAEPMPATAAGTEAEADAETLLAAAPVVLSIVCVQSAAVTFQTVATSPSMPRPPSLASRERKALKLKWTPPEELGGADVGPMQYALYCKPPPTEHKEGLDGEGFAEVYLGEERSTKVGKLQPGSRYSFKLKASNRIGDSPVSLCSTFTTQATVPSQPDPPTVLSTTSDSIVLQWTRPFENGSPVTAYRLERDDGQGGNDFQLVYAGIQLTATATGLRHGLRYGFRLLAENDEGKSMWSVCAYATTAPVAPSSPCNLAVVGVHRTSATLSWRAPEDDGGSAPCSYEVQLQAKCRAALEHMGTEWLTIFQGNALACTISSLRAGCTYRSRVRSASIAGWGLFSVPVDVVTAPDVPDAPEPPVLGIAEPTFLGVQWSPPSHNGGAKIHQYRLEVAQESPCTCGTCPSPAPSAPSVPGSPRSATSGAVTPPPVLQRPCMGALQLSSVQMTTAGEVCTAEIRDLTPSTGYFFRVVAGNAIGLGGWSDWIRMSTLADVPLPPGRLQYVAEQRSGSPSGVETAAATVPGPLAAAASGNGPGAASSPVAAVSALVTWQAAFTRGATVQQYILQAALQGASSTGQGADGAGLQYYSVYGGLSCSCLVKGLRPAGAYCFRVAAVSAVGVSDWSDVLALDAPAAAPAAPEHVLATPVYTDANAIQQLQQGEPSADAPGMPGALSTQTFTQSVALSWRPPACDNGAAVVLYLIDVSPPPPGVARLLSPSPSASGLAMPKQGRRGPGASGPSASASSASSVPWGQVQTVSAPANSTVISGLLPGRAYQFRVRAVNSVGCSAAGATASVTTPAMPPLQPQRMKVISRTSNGVRVRWEDPAEDNGAPVLQYELQVAAQQQQDSTALADGDASAAGDAAEAQGRLHWQQAYAGRDSQARVLGLEPNQPYLLRCRAVNAAGPGPWGDLVQTSTALAPPGAPHGVMVSTQAPLPSLQQRTDAIGSDGAHGQGHSLTLRWKASEDPPSCAAAIGYEVVVAIAGMAGVGLGADAGPAASAATAAAWNAPVAKAVVGKGVTEWQVEGLAAGTTYAARVRAVGAEGSGHSGWSEEAVKTTEGRSAMRASASGDGGALADGFGTATSFTSGAGKRGKGKKDAARHKLSASSALCAQDVASMADDCSVASSSVSSFMVTGSAPGALGLAIGGTPSFTKPGRAGSAASLAAAGVPAPSPATRKQPKAKTLVAAAAIPMAAARPTRRGLLEQAWRKVQKAIRTHWWKVLLLWLAVWLLLWLIGKV